MTTEAIVESGMTFGPYPEGQCFYIESSQFYQAVRGSVAIAEFALLRVQESGPVVWIVEAKSSTPRPDNKQDLPEFINEIKNKFANMLSLLIAACLQRHPDAMKELPDSFKKLNLQTQGFHFALVINGHKREWLPPLQDALRPALKPLLNIWGIPNSSLVVLNHESAQRCGLILSSIPAEAHNG